MQQKEYGKGEQIAQKAELQTIAKERTNIVIMLHISVNLQRKKKYWAIFHYVKEGIYSLYNDYFYSELSLLKKFPTF